MTLPSGIEVELKDKLSYGDQKKIYAVMGNMEIGNDIKPTINQAFALMGVTVFYNIKSWSVNKELTQENLEDELTEEDVNTIMTEIGIRNEAKKKLIDSSLSQ